MVIFHCYVSLPQGNMAAWYRRYIFKWCFLSIVILVFRAVTCLELAGSWTNWFNATQKKPSWGCECCLSQFFWQFVCRDISRGTNPGNLLVIRTTPPKNHMKPEHYGPFWTDFIFQTPIWGSMLVWGFFCSNSCHLGVMSSFRLHHVFKNCWLCAFWFGDHRHGKPWDNHHATSTNALNRQQ